MSSSTLKIAILNDYQNIALKIADWSAIPGNPEITVFNDHVSELEPLVQRLREHKIAGAGIDVFDQEPLPGEHPFRHLPNVLATPHLGYGTRSLYEIFYQDSVDNIRAWVAENS